MNLCAPRKTSGWHPKNDALVSSCSVIFRFQPLLYLVFAGANDIPWVL